MKLLKAIVCEEFGPAEVLQLKEVEEPVPKDDEVLVKVHAVGINAIDIFFRNGAKKMFGLMRLMMSGIFKPRIKITGGDLSGEVVAVGKKVTFFKEGDQIYGCAKKGGACAEFCCVPEKDIAIKPATMTYAEAAAAPAAGCMAIWALRDQGKIQSGQKVCIYGASGGNGTFAVQTAKSYGTEVTGVCSERNFDLVRSLGADTVIDYIKEDFTERGDFYDIIFDAVGKNSFSNCKKALTPNGIYVTVDFMSPRRHILQMLWTKLKKKKIKGGMMELSTATLDSLRELIEAGKVKSVIEKTYQLNETAEAHRYYEQGHTTGKIVISVQD